MGFRSNPPTATMLGSREFHEFQTLWLPSTEDGHLKSLERLSRTGKFGWIFHFKKYLFYFFPQDSLEIVGTCNLCYLICINIMIFFSEDNLQSVDFGVLHPFTEILKKIISNE